MNLFTKLVTQTDNETIENLSPNYNTCVIALII